MKLLACLAATAAIAFSAGAAPVAGLSLGSGLAYFRVHELPADLPSTPAARPGPCVLDIRFAKSDGTSASLLGDWVRFNASAASPVFVLENSETSSALLALFNGSGAGGVIVLAPAAEKLSPTVSVHVDAGTDRRAYEAVEKGAPLSSLLADNPGKQRIDEAYLEKEHIADSDAPDIETDKPSPPSPLVDFMLQRAIQLHRRPHRAQEVLRAWRAIVRVLPFPAESCPFQVRCPNRDISLSFARETFAEARWGRPSSGTP